MNTYGTKLKISIFGQSHSDAIGVSIDGLPAGFSIDTNALAAFTARRAPGQDKLSTTRKEADIPEIISGIADGKTCGAPLCAIIKNGDCRSRDYDKLKKVPRPGHADYAAYIKFGGCNDIRGGGQFSGRLTAPLCIAGGIALQILDSMGIKIAAHIYEIAGIKDTPFDPVNVCGNDFSRIGSFPVLNGDAGEKMAQAVLEAKKDGDSVGGIIECAVIGLEAGYGSPMFEGVENVISQAVFAIPAVKGIEFGAGFEVARMRGSQNNDSFITDGVTVHTKTNNSGGILGGITTGMPIIFRAAFKPTPSIALQQKSVNMEELNNCNLIVEGRHDPCVVPRAVVAVEAATAVAVLDMILQGK
ncbi:MAG: chorismate synthase [Ruminococcaceae bacterium]|nr:chorismate synthase [Oscillospiraceae bacterium]